MTTAALNRVAKSRRADSVIEPDGRAIASPVWDAPDCLVPTGNLHEQTAEELWTAYPYKNEHLNKYLERTMMVVD